MAILMNVLHMYELHSIFQDSYSYMPNGRCRGMGRECNEEKDTVSPAIELFKVEEHCFGQSL